MYFVVLQGMNESVWEVTADFRRLSVLLMRAEEQSHGWVGLKIATATMCDAKVQLTLGKLSQSADCLIYFSANFKFLPFVIL